MSTIAQQVRDLGALTAAQLAERYADLYGRPPHARNRAFLQRRVAWKLQERELGGLSERAMARLDELVAQVDLVLAAQPLASPRPARAAPRTPMVGTTLTREWRGQMIRVEVRDGGFEWNGVLYRSLSAVAKAITGATWSGALFFGLRKRRAGA